MLFRPEISFGSGLLIPVFGKIMMRTKTDVRLGEFLLNLSRDEREKMWENSGKLFLLFIILLRCIFYLIFITVLQTESVWHLWGFIFLIFCRILCYIVISAPASECHPTVCDNHENPTTPLSPCPLAIGTLPPQLSPLKPENLFIATQ